MLSIAVVDDEARVRRSIGRVLSRRGADVEEFSRGEDLLRRYDRSRPVDRGRPNKPDLVFLDLRLDGLSGLEVLGRLRKQSVDVPVVILTGYGDVPNAVEAMKLGATEFLQKPMSKRAIERVVDQHTHVRSGESSCLLRGEEQEQLADELTFVGRSDPMRHLVDVVRKVAASDARAVLIQGETGTGKEIVAQTLHALSRRCAAPFVPINSGAISASLLESELFGYARGAFTGAVAGGRPGRIEFANGGTVFLDEIGDMDTGLQVKLLRTLETGEVRRVGANELMHVDVRFLAATHQPVQQLIEEGRFRSDLYHRLSVVTLTVPPLRDRGDDVLLLSEHFLDSISNALGTPPPRLSRAAKSCLLRYSWPGNVRELRNLMERMVILGGSGAIGAEMLCLDETSPASLDIGDEDSERRAMLDLAGMSLDDVEQATVRFAIKSSDGNLTEAARRLRIGYGALRRRVARYAIAD